MCYQLIKYLKMQPSARASPYRPAPGHVNPVHSFDLWVPYLRFIFLSPPSGGFFKASSLAASPALVLGDHSRIPITWHLALTTLTMRQIQWRRQRKRLLQHCIHSHPGPTQP